MRIPLRSHDVPRRMSEWMVKYVSGSRIDECKYTNIAVVSVFRKWQVFGRSKVCSIIARKKR